MTAETSHTNNKYYALALPAVLVVAADQVSKYLVRTTPELQNWEVIPGLLAFHYTQNSGMALGINWFPTWAISLIAIAVVIGLIWYILKTMHQATGGYLACMGLIIGGAFGNIIDRLVMARLESYGGILDGHVVDFIHFTPITPDWVPYLGGWPVFPYIFNVADMAISTAIIVLLLFHRKFLHIEEEGGDSGKDAASAKAAGAAESGSGKGDAATAP